MYASFITDGKKFILMLCLTLGVIDKKWGKGTAEKNRDDIRIRVNQKFIDQQKKIKMDKKEFILSENVVED